MLRNISFFSAVLVLAFASELLSVTLFEIKDEMGSPVLVVSTDGLRILSGADTLMVISSSEIRANIKEDDTKALSRTFSVSTTSAKGSQGNIMNVTTDGMRIYDQTPETGKALGDTLMTISSRAIKAYISNSGKALSRTFSVSTTSAKGAPNALEVGTDYTTMSDGSGKYTDFSPENIFIGLNSGASTTSGSGNAVMGNNAGLNNITGNSNVMIGESAGKMFDGSFGNVFIGQEAAENLYYGHRNVVLGYRAGSAPANSDSLFGNVYIGAVAGKAVRGSYNVMIGEAAGENYQTGGSSGYDNVFIGRECGQHSTGHENVYIGYHAGRGEDSNVHTGSNNIYIGNSAGWADVTESNSFRLGSLLWGDLDGPRMLVVNGERTDNSNGRVLFSNGSAGGTTVWNNDSDERLKKNITTIEGALDKVMKLRGVTYEWKDVEKYEKGRRMGFIAQESKDIIPEAVDYDSENDRYTMQYSTVTAVLVEAIKELKKEVSTSVAALESKEIESKKVIDGQTEKINILINENKDLKNKVQELESLRAEIDQIKRQIAGYTSK